MNNKSVFLSNLFYFYAKTDGTYAFPNSSEGDLLKTAKKEIEEYEKEIAKLREALKEISTTAHCIAKAGPLNTPTLQDAWGKFMAIDAMATKALSK